jgi:acyl carrier protein
MLDMHRDARATIRLFVTERLAPAVGLDRPLDDEEDLIDSGVVDSLGIFQLIAFLEERFGIKIGDEEITPENFGTIAAIDRLVAARIR